MPNRNQMGPRNGSGSGRGKGFRRGGCCDEMNSDNISIAKMFLLKKHCSENIDASEKLMMLIEEEEILKNELQRVQKEIEKRQK